MNSGETRRKFLAERKEKQNWDKVSTEVAFVQKFLVFLE